MQRSTILITGGAGFIGTNVARSYLKEGKFVHIFDNLSRAGVEANVAELQREFPRQILFTQADVRDGGAVKKAVASATAVYHFAAQVAVTTSLEDPVADLETNLLGTINVLESIRSCATRPPLLFTSTNKVYGKLRFLALDEFATRYQPVDGSEFRTGVNEDQPLEFLSPYGCSKGSADQYVLDYAKSYDLPAVVFRMSCIYGPYQMGSEDQGWVAHFLRQALKGEPITIYGDGKQVRDLLFAEDLVRAMRAAMDRIRDVAGEAFNVGGGARQNASLLEVLDQIRAFAGCDVRLQHGPERLGDQRWYVSDISKIHSYLQWSPAVGVGEGLRTLYDWYMSRPALVHQTMTQTEVQVA